MSVTIGTIAGSTGLGSERQVITLASGDLWAFGYTGTSTLATWYSQDGGISWTAGATHALANPHSSEGRNLAVAYKRIGSTDRVQIGLIYKSGTSLAAQVVGASIAGTLITFHSSETAVSTPTADSASLFWAGSGLEYDANNKLHFSNGWADGGNGDGNSSDSTGDAGTAEQMTPVTWAGHNIYSDNAKQVRSGCGIDLGGGSFGLVLDDGSAISTATGLNWLTWNGSVWASAASTDRHVTGTISAIGKNDWGAVKVSNTDVHVVYRDSSSTLIHLRWNGTAWGAGETIPAQNSLADGGIALCSDGISVWLLVIDTDAANTVRQLRWTSLAGNGIQDAWDATWTALESSTATRTFIGCTRDIYNQTGLAYWTEGNTLVAASFAAIPPIDPSGLFLQSWQASSAVSATTFGVTATTQNVVAGNRILVAVTIWNSTATTITSVTDSAGNTYTKDNEKVASDGTHTSHWSAPITAGGGTKPTVTAHASAATAEWAIHCLEYLNLSRFTSGGTDGSNAFTGNATSPMTSGASTPAPNVAGEIAFWTYGDGGNNIAAIGVSAGGVQRGTSIQGSSTTAQQAVADSLSAVGVGINASFTLSGTGSPANVLVTVYKILASSGTPVVGRVPPRPWLARIMEARVKPLGLAALSTSPISDVDTSSGSDGVTSVGLTGTDVGTGADAAASIGLSAVDTGTGADGGTGVGLSAVDVGNAADAVTAIGVVGVDIGAGADSVALVGLAGTDAGIGTDTPTIVGVGSTDAATGTDGASVGLSSVDVAAGVDGVTLTALSAVDTATATDSGSAVDLGSTPKSSSDTATGSDAITLVALNAADMAVAFDAGTFAATLTSGDTAVGVDSVSRVGLSAVNVALGSDLAILVGVGAGDAAGVVDGGSVVVAGAPAQSAQRERHGASRPTVFDPGSRPPGAWRGGRSGNVGAGSRPGGSHGNRPGSGSSGRRNTT